MAPPGHDPQAQERRELRLRVPADQRYVELARLAVTGVAARNGCTTAAVEALDAEFGPAFATLTSDPGDADLTVTADVGDEAVAFELARRPARGMEPIRLSDQR